jgi:hypothetical protein
VLVKYQRQIKVFISLQAFGQKILVPFNYGNGFIRRQQDLLNWGRKIAARIYRINRTRFQVAVGYRVSPESGTPSDFAAGKLRIPVTYTIELPRGGATGYEVPESKLDGILEESFEGFLEITKMPRF